MKIITQLSLGLTAITLALVLTALCLQDPLLRKCEMVDWQLSLIEQDPWNRLYLEKCRRMLHEAESRMHKARLCKERIRTARQHYALSHEHSRALSRLEAQHLALRIEADSLLEEIKFVMEVRRQGP